MLVKTAGRTFDLLELFAQEQRPLSLTELGRLMAIPISSCFGLVRTLQARGYLYEARRRAGYYPTKRLLTVSQRISAGDDFVGRFERVLDDLRNASGETVVLAKLQEQRVVYLDVYESRQTIRYSAEIGEHRNPHANSLGKALLAAMSSAERRKYLEGYPWTRYTARTIDSFEALERDLGASATRGWFSNVGESLPDIAGVACNVSVDGERVAVSIAGPLYRMEARLAEHGERLVSTCRKDMGVLTG